MIPEGEDPYLEGLPGAEVARIYKVSEELVQVRRVSTVELYERR